MSPEPSPPVTGAGEDQPKTFHCFPVAWSKEEEEFHSIRNLDLVYRVPPGLFVRKRRWLTVSRCLTPLQSPTNMSQGSSQPSHRSQYCHGSEDSQSSPSSQLHQSPVHTSSHPQLSPSSFLLFLQNTSKVFGDPLEHPQKEEYWGNVNPIGDRSCYDEGKRVADV